MLARMSSSVSGGRSAVRPDGSPILAVMSPTMKTTWWPIRWNRLAMIIGTAWPTCTSGGGRVDPELDDQLPSLGTGCGQPRGQVIGGRQELLGPGGDQRRLLGRGKVGQVHRPPLAEQFEDLGESRVLRAAPARRPGWS